MMMFQFDTKADLVEALTKDAKRYETAAAKAKGPKAKAIAQEGAYAIHSCIYLIEHSNVTVDPALRSRF